MADSMDWETNTSNVYPISSKCDYKRLAVLIYTNETRSPYGESDFILLNKLWRTLKFRVIPVPDPSLVDLDNVVCNITSIVDSNPDEHDMLCICYIGHGGREENEVRGRTFKYEYIELKDGATIEMDKLCSKFSTLKCKGLAGVPKMVFAQCCRGFGDEIPSELYASVEVIPENTDFFILNACVSGNRAIYNRQSGQSAFMNIVCTVFERDYKTEDVLSMATNVVNEIKDKRQTPELRSTLRKKLYLSGVRSATLPRFIRPRPDLSIQNQQTSTASCSQYGTADNDAAILPMKQRHLCFLDLDYKGTKLGRITIQLTTEYPRWSQQFHTLASGGCGGGATWRGASFYGVYNYNRPGEFLGCRQYVSASGDLTRTPLFAVESAAPARQPCEGDVHGRGGGGAGFMITTRSCGGTWTNCPVIGRVTSGLPLLKTIATKGEDYAQEVKFADCGVTL